MQACLSEDPTERPSFADLVVLLDDTCSEVLSGLYINSQGRQVVRCCLCSAHMASLLLMLNALLVIVCKCSHKRVPFWSRDA